MTDEKDKPQYLNMDQVIDGSLINKWAFENVPKAHRWMVAQITEDSLTAIVMLYRSGVDSKSLSVSFSLTKDQLFWSICPEHGSPDGYESIWARFNTKSGQFECNNIIPESLLKDGMYKHHILPHKTRYEFFKYEYPQLKDSLKLFTGRRTLFMCYIPNEVLEFQLLPVNIVQRQHDLTNRDVSDKRNLELDISLSGIQYDLVKRRIGSCGTQAFGVIRKRYFKSKRFEQRQAHCIALQYAADELAKSLTKEEQNEKDD